MRTVWSVLPQSTFEANARPKRHRGRGLPFRILLSGSPRKSQRSDSMIESGEDREKYKEVLFTADLVIIFGSSDFIADDTNFNRVKKVIIRYNNRETRLMAVIVRNFLWKEPFFGKLPVILPSAQRPLYDQKTWSIDDAFATVAQEMIDVITKHYKIEQSTIEINPW